jgi:hypothetical protein
MARSSRRTRRRVIVFESAARGLRTFTRGWPGGAARQSAVAFAGFGCSAHRVLAPADVARKSAPSRECLRPALASFFAVRHSAAFCLRAHFTSVACRASPRSLRTRRAPHPKPADSETRRLRNPLPVRPAYPKPAHKYFATKSTNAFQSAGVAACPPVW